MNTFRTITRIVFIIATLLLIVGCAPTAVPPDEMVEVPPTNTPEPTQTTTAVPSPTEITSPTPTLTATILSPQILMGWTPLSELGLVDEGDLFSLEIEENGTIWLGTIDNGIYQLDESGWRHYTSADGLPSNESEDFGSFFNVKVIGEGAVVAGSCGHISILDADQWQPYVKKPINPLYEYMCPWSLDSSEDGTLWFTILEPDPVGYGIFNYSSEGWHNFAEYSPDELDPEIPMSSFDLGLQDNFFSALMVDSKDILWATGINNIIVKYDGIAWTAFTEFMTLEEQYFAGIFEDSLGNIILISNEGQLIQYDHQSLTAYQLPAQLMNGSWQTELGPDDVFWSIPIWSSGEPGIFRFTVADLEQISLPTSENRVQDWLNGLPEFIPSKLITIPAGQFLMGNDYDQKRADEAYVGTKYYEEVFDESPPHEVYLDTYGIDATEVTVAQYGACIADGVCTLPSGWLEALEYFSEDYAQPDFPMTHVSWHESQEYCAWREMRLPTEAEWEKAARGSDGRLFPWGKEGLDCSLANFSSNCNRTLIAVGSLPTGASPFGVLDMIGNPSEWVQDWYDPEYYTVSPESNPMGLEEGPLIEDSWGLSDPKRERVVRGGSYFEDIGEDHSQDPGFTDFWYRYSTFTRDGHDPDSGEPYLSFRCAVSP